MELTNNRVLVVGLGKSNLSEFPDNGSYKSEDRVLAFEFAKDATIRME